MKKVLFISLAVALVVVPGSYAALIGNFEGSLDGWLPNDAAISMSSIGASVGSGSMLISGPGGWHIDCRLDLKPIMGILGSTTQISADVTAFASDMTVSWMNMEMIYNGQNNDDSGTNNNIGWNSLGGRDILGDGITHTLTWDVPEALMNKLAGVDNNIWWLELMIISNNDGQNAMFYVDNVQLIPEPATMSLLGLGGLAFLRRRK
jgi:hypothetical protein